MKRLIVIGSLTALCGVFGVQSCQDDSGAKSDAKSLGNLENEAAGKDQVVNHCVGTNAVNGGLKLPLGSIRGASTDALKDAVNSTLTAVPSSITFAFFQLGGAIELRDNALQACSGAVASQDELSQEGACLVMDASARSLSIIISPSEKAIFHGLTRAMGVFYAMGIARAGRSELDSLIYQEPDPGIVGSWNDVRSSFLTELPEDLRDDEVITSATPVRIYSEAFDSAYCSQSTRMDINRYPKTMAAFAKTTDHLEQIDASLTKALKTRQLSDFKVLSATNGAQKRLAALVQWGVELNLKGDGEAALTENGEGLGLVQAKGAPVATPAKGAEPVKAGQSQFAANAAKGSKAGGDVGAGGFTQAAGAQQAAQPILTKTPAAVASPAAALPTGPIGDFNTSAYVEGLALWEDFEPL